VTAAAIVKRAAGALPSLDRARAILASKETIREVREMDTLAQAVKSHAVTEEAKVHAAAISLLCKARIGELTRQIKAEPARVTGARGGRGRKAVAGADTLSRTARLEAEGLTRTAAAECETISRLDERGDLARYIGAQRAAGEVPSTDGALRLARGHGGSVFATKTDVEWYTPPEYIEAAREALGGGIDLDPASCLEANAVVRALRFLSREDDGLHKPWVGRVWLNPPYGRDDDDGTGAWTAKMIEEHRAGRVTAGVMLVGACTETRWFRPLFEYPICFPEGRLPFRLPNGKLANGVKGSAIVYVGNDVARFQAAYRRFGAIVGRLP
jgi:hypothetical protein